MSAGLLDESGNPKNLKQGLIVDSFATLGAGLLGTSSGTAYIESAAGITADPASLDASLHPAKRAYQAHLRAGKPHEDGWTLLMHEVLRGAGVPDLSIRSAMPALRRAHDELYFWRKVPLELPAALERARDAGLRLAIVSNSEGKLRSVLERVTIADIAAGRLPAEVTALLATPDAWARR